MAGSVSPLTMEIPCLPSEPVEHRLETPSPHHLRETVIHLRDRALVDALTQPAAPAPMAVEAMQKLVALMRHLRSLNPAWRTPTPPTPDTLLPYVSDEAQDVLEALTSPSRPAESQSPHNMGLMRLETLSPRLLWCVARSGYSTMQLLEGLPARVCPPAGAWQSGIMRLAVSVELVDAGTTPPVNTAMDLALGCPSHVPLTNDWLIQLDQDIDFQPDWHLATAERSERSLFWVQRSLDAITQQLIATHPLLQSWLDGIEVEWLTANDRWHSGTLRLNLAIDFMPQAVEHYQPRPDRMTPIDAELLDEAEAQPSTAFAAELDSLTTMPITVVDMPPTPAIATTIIRLPTSAQLDQFTQFAQDQALMQLLQSCQRPLHASTKEGLAALIQSAYRFTEMGDAALTSSFCLLQPELLMDELLPKLLWHITRSSFISVEWLGGCPCHLLQPQSDWQTGTLRLRGILEIRTQGEQWWIDLVTGRFVPAEPWQPSPAIARPLHAQPAEIIAIAQLQQQLQQAIATAPELAALINGIKIEWLTPEHDWQVGQLRLHLDLEFSPDLF